MLDDPEFQFKINKTRIMIVSSFRTLMLTCLMCFMAWTAYISWVVVYCQTTENCARHQGDDDGGPYEIPDLQGQLDGPVDQAKPILFP